MPDTSGTTTQRGTLGAFALAALGYTAIVLLLFHGLVGQFSTALPHDLGDPLLSTSVLWWNAHRLPFVGTWWDGLSFFPGHGSLAFSDHRVGLTPFANPVQWLGGTPVLAYNITLLSSFVLAALAAHALAWTLTRSHAAGAVAGLIFGFNPFRMSHVAHLELLAVCWLPLAFVALHLYVRRFETRWLVLFAVLWLLQGLSSGYYLFYSAPVIALWTVWFARDRLWRSLVSVGVACAAVFVVLSPVFLRYQQIQSQLLLARGFGEIEFFSADVTGILSATPTMALWRFPSLATNGEAEIYLGVFAPLLVVAGLLWRRRAEDTVLRSSRWPAWKIVVAVIGGMYAAIAIGTLFGAWSFKLGPLTVSASQTERPLSIVAFAALLLGLTSARFRAVFAERSTFAFYTIAAVMTWLFTLGPRPKFLGHTLLHRGPYTLLMLLPGFDERLRVPSRFVMMTIFAVAIAAGIAFVRLTSRAPRAIRIIATGLVLFAITADSWTFTLPMPTAPPLIRLPSTVPATAAVLELPLGNVGPDIAAVYHTIGHGRPVVNGYSGYEPPHYRAVHLGLEARDQSLLTELTTFAPLAVIVTHDDPVGNWAAFVEAHPGVIRLQETADYLLFLLPSTSPDSRPLEPVLPIRAATSNVAPIELSTITDGNPKTAWGTPMPQHGGEEIVLELETPAQVSGVTLVTGPAVQNYPRELAISTSVDGQEWRDVWTGGTAGAALDGVLKDPRTVAIRIPFASAPARFVRLRQLRPHPVNGWTLADISLHGHASTTP